MKQDENEAFLIMPISNVDVNYRDVHPAPVARPTDFDPLILSPILGAPDVVVPIGEYGYDSRVSERRESLPISINIIGLPGSDLPFDRYHSQIASRPQKRPTVVSDWDQECLSERLTRSI